jgi:serine/threonine protein kinase
MTLVRKHSTDFGLIYLLFFFVLQDYVLTEAKCRTIMRQICRGVQFIHSQGFLHLDLKPFNIVFSKRRDDYDLRIIDFGLARDLGGSSSVKVRLKKYLKFKNIQKN